MMATIKHKLLLSFFISIPEGCKRIMSCNCSKNKLTYSLFIRMDDDDDDHRWKEGRKEGRKGRKSK
jgi:hypothetical protein